MNAVTVPKLHVLILAAGFSRRLGLPKALVRVHGVSLLARTLKIVAKLGPARTTVVVPPRNGAYRAAAGNLAVEYMVNARRAEGLSSSIRCGLARARYAGAVLLLPVDLVALQHRDLGHLVARWRASPRCVVARRIGSDPATPLLLPAWLFPSAARVSGDRGLRDFVRTLAPEHWITLELPSAAQDIDTPQELAAARRRMTSKIS
jgi:molybdenum cofactor cytidylyltransferase